MGMNNLVATEHQEQVALMQWWGYYSQAHSIPETLLFAIPNGSFRQKVTGAILKAEGVRAGVSDLFLAYPSGQYHGAFIELKRDRKASRVTVMQKRFLKFARDFGYYAVVAYGFEDAKHVIESYVGGKFDA